MDKDNLEKIMNSNKLTMTEKMETIKEEMKILLRPCSYLEIFNKLKISRLSTKVKDLYLNLYDQALEELLEEKQKELTKEQIDEILGYFKKETDKTRDFIKETKSTLLSPKEVKETSRKIPNDNLVRIAIAAEEGTLSEDQKKVLNNEGKKGILCDKESDLKVIDECEKKLLKELTDRKKKQTF